jgi:DNA-directed RNA polymerase subunit RPC12/RpoP
MSNCAECGTPVKDEELNPIPQHEDGFNYYKYVCEKCYTKIIDETLMIKLFFPSYKSKFRE